jgi:hypothetical protein
MNKTKLKKLLIAFLIGWICTTFCIIICCKKVDFKVKEKHEKSELEKKKEYFEPAFLFSVHGIKVYRFYDKGKWHHMYISKKDVEGIPEDIKYEGESN